MRHREMRDSTRDGELRFLSCFIPEELLRFLRSMSHRHLTDALALPIMGVHFNIHKLVITGHIKELRTK